MPHFSTFTRFGFLRYSKKASQHQLVYDAYVSALGADNGKSFDMTPGTHEEATVYCRAQVIARTRGLLERAGNQHDNARALEMLPERERDHRIIVPQGATIQQRRETLVARGRLNRGARRENVEDQLETLLGVDFLNYRVVAESESTLWPTSPGSGPGVYPLANRPTKNLRLLGGNTAIGSAWVSYGNLDSEDEDAAADLLLVGDEVCVNAGDPANGEVLTVTGTQTTVLLVNQFRATFTLFHPYDAVVTTGPFPAQFSTRRLAFIIVSDDVSTDPVMRAKINDVMSRVARGVSQWAIVKKTTGTTIGPFILGLSPLGAVPFGAITI